MGYHRRQGQHRGRHPEELRLSGGHRESALAREYCGEAATQPVEDFGSREELCWDNILWEQWEEAIPGPGRNGGKQRTWRIFFKLFTQQISVQVSKQHQQASNSTSSQLTNSTNHSSPLVSLRPICRLQSAAFFLLFSYCPIAYQLCRYLAVALLLLCLALSVLFDLIR